MPFHEPMFQRFSRLSAYLTVTGFTSPQSAESHLVVKDIFAFMGWSPDAFMTMLPLACSESTRSMRRSPVMVIFACVHSIWTLCMDDEEDTTFFVQFSFWPI